MKIDYNKTAIIPLDYSKGSKGLWLAVKKNNKYILRLLAIFETALIEQIKISNRDLFDYNVFYNLKEALLDYDFTLTKKNYNQLDALASINEKKHYEQYLTIFCRSKRKKYIICTLLKNNNYSQKKKSNTTPNIIIYIFFYLRVKL